jgi:hypothetical protein
VTGAKIYVDRELGTARKKRYTAELRVGIREHFTKSRLRTLSDYGDTLLNDFHSVKSVTPCRRLDKESTIFVDGN